MGQPRREPLRARRAERPEAPFRPADRDPALGPAADSDQTDGMTSTEAALARPVPEGARDVSRSASSGSYRREALGSVAQQPGTKTGTRSEEPDELGTPYTRALLSSEGPRAAVAATGGVQDALPAVVSWWRRASPGARMLAFLGVSLVLALSLSLLGILFATSDGDRCEESFVSLHSRALVRDFFPSFRHCPSIGAWVHGYREAGLADPDPTDAYVRQPSLVVGVTCDSAREGEAPSALEVPTYVGPSSVCRAWDECNDVEAAREPFGSALRCEARVDRASPDTRSLVSAATDFSPATQPSLAFEPPTPSPEVQDPGGSLGHGPQDGAPTASTSSPRCPSGQPAGSVLSFRTKYIEDKDAYVTYMSGSITNRAGADVVIHEAYRKDANS